MSGTMPAAGAAVVWLARPSHLMAGALRAGKGRPFPFAPRAVKLDGLASQTRAGAAASTKRGLIH